MIGKASYFSQTYMSSNHTISYMSRGPLCRFAEPQFPMLKTALPIKPFHPGTAEKKS